MILLNYFVKLFTYFKNFIIYFMFHLFIFSMIISICSIIFNLILLFIVMLFMPNFYFIQLPYFSTSNYSISITVTVFFSRHPLIFKPVDYIFWIISFVPFLQLWYIINFSFAHTINLNHCHCLTYLLPHRNPASIFKADFIKFIAIFFFTENHIFFYLFHVFLFSLRQPSHSISNYFILRILIWMALTDFLVLAVLRFHNLVFSSLDCMFHWIICFSQSLNVLVDDLLFHNHDSLNQQ